MSIDSCLHSLFGVSKVSADLMVQEYGRYFGMKTVCFRCGCITGPEHRGAELHGFLAYLMKCAKEHRTYTIYGYKGKQVRDNIHANDLVKAFECFIKDPKEAAVYNMGGGREVNCSILEAVDMCEWFTGDKMDIKHNPDARIGDHKWWISNTNKFRNDYPEWELKNGVYTMLSEIHERC
jgi:CDP-paratose 2-epimerase